jgi:hypothetical protein
MGRAERIVQAILRDFTDRRGLRHEWDRIDDGIQKEIVDTWTALVETALREPDGAPPATAAAPALVWGYSLHEHPDTWSGHCASREEAIAEGKRELSAQLQAEGDGDTLREFWIMSGSTPDPADAMPSVDSVCDQMSAFARDNWGDVAEEFPEVSENAREELADAMATWAREHAKPRFWVVTTPGPGRFRSAERIEVT